MASAKFPPCPPQLKIVQHYLKLGADYEQRDSAISYWARLYTLQSALKIDKKSPEAKALLTALMDYLENFKKQNTDNEGVTNDIAAQAMIENEAHKLFTHADNADRSAKFDKNVVKSFYTAGILLDICEVFGSLSEELLAQRKYAKWKATYIHNCLKSGEIPISGPVGESGDGMRDRSESDESNTTGNNNTFDLPQVPTEFSMPNQPQPPINQYSFMPHQPMNLPASQPQVYERPMEPAKDGRVELNPEQCLKTQKYCKYAISSIDYEDFPTAIDYLQKALQLLTTGRDA